MTRRLLITVIVTVTLLLAAIVLYRLSYDKLRSYETAVEHTQEVIFNFSEINSLLKSVKIYSRNYNYIGSRDWLDRYINVKSNTNRHLWLVTELVKDNAEQRLRLDSLKSSVGQLIKVTDHQIATRDPIQVDSLNRLAIYLLVDKPEGIIQRGIQAEEILLKARQSAMNAWEDWMNVWIALFIGAAMILLIISSAANYEQFRKRQSAEDFLQTILNTTQNGVMTYEPISTGGEIDDFRVTYANRGIVQQLKQNPEDVIGKTYFEMWPKALHTGTFDKFVNVFRSGVPENFEINSIEENSNDWFYVSAVRMQNGITVTFNNITKIKQFEAQLQQKIQELVRTNSELEQFAYVSSHDLQEPLRKIEMFSTLTEQRFSKDLPDEAATYLKKIALSSKRMRNLINDLLNYSRVSRSREPYVSTNLAKVLNDLVDDLELTVAEKNATIKTNSLPTLEAVPLQMNQLFQNLLSNSLKFTVPERTPLIYVKTEKATPQEIVSNEHLDSSLDYYKITWSDNGIGFDPQFSDKIFTIFQRLHTRDQYEGTGIGLALCKKIVFNHNGDIQAHSSDDVGAMFCIFLPVKQRELTQAEAAS